MHAERKDWILITTSETYQWSFVTQLYRNGKASTNNVYTSALRSKHVGQTKKLNMNKYCEESRSH